ncbi:DUF6415 family natural product biosynthesis protein [Streptomyces sp. NPDC059743]|uniref:DUF6415 family natural product biosynthesis protein n=1 Tax=Streptomyces sp. NPDC059743 TaxID=3346928 RepID=UPI00365F53EB
MPESTAGTTAPDAESWPLDFTTMVKTARRVVDSGAQLSGEDLEMAVLRLRGHLALLIPEVEDRLGRLAPVGIEEARRRLDGESGPLGPRWYAQCLAQSVLALCDHLNSTDCSVVVLRWSRDPRCVALARVELRKALADWGLSVLEDSAVLIVSELLSNARLHAQVTPEQSIETRYFRRPGGLRIEVHDGSPKRPQRRTPDPDAPDGRGLLLVEALADEWGVAERGGPGKAVWAALSMPLVRPGEAGCS